MSVGVSMKKLVVGYGFGVYKCSQALLYGFYDVQYGAVGLVSEQVVCVRGCILPSRRGG